MSRPGEGRAQLGRSWRRAGTLAALGLLPLSWWALQRFCEAFAGITRDRAPNPSSPAGLLCWSHLDSYAWLVTAAVACLGLGWLLEARPRAARPPGARPPLAGGLLTSLGRILALLALAVLLLALLVFLRLGL